MKSATCRWTGPKDIDFQLVSRSYERGTMIITGNKSFAESGQVFGDDVLAIAYSTGSGTTST
jgi:DNA replication protein DnaC